jgi:hypothetical protein
MTSYQQLATDVLDALDAMMEAVPKLEQKERRSKAFIRTHLGIPQKFVDTTVGAVAYTPELEKLNQMNLAAAYSSRYLGLAFRPVVSALVCVTEELQLLLDTRQANAAAEALKIYAIAKMLIRRKTRGNPGDVSPAKVAQMKRDLGRRGPRKKKAGADSASPARKKPRRRRKLRTIRQRLQRRMKPTAD